MSLREEVTVQQSECRRFPGGGKRGGEGERERVKGFLGVGTREAGRQTDRQDEQDGQEREL